MRKRTARQRVLSLPNGNLDFTVRRLTLASGAARANQRHRLGEDGAAASGFVSTGGEKRRRRRYLEQTPCMHTISIEGLWDALRALPSRPLCSCDSRWVSPRYVSAGL